MAEKDEMRRRKYPRVKDNCSLRFKVITEAPIESDGVSAHDMGVAINISGGGMCFSANKPLAPGTMITCEMKLSQLPTPVVSFGKVVWCERSESPATFDIGLEFWWIGWSDAEAQDKMLKYINSKLSPFGDADSN